MITLYASGLHFGLPDASPFLTKCPLFESDAGRYAAAQPNLVSYVKRTTEECYPLRKQCLQPASASM